MTTRHYKLEKIGHELFSFTSPLGRHTLAYHYNAAKGRMQTVKERHRRRAQREGAEAGLLAEYFNQ